MNAAASGTMAPSSLPARFRRACPSCLTCHPPRATRRAACAPLAIACLARLGVCVAAPRTVCTDHGQLRRRARGPQVVACLPGTSVSSSSSNAAGPTGSRPRAAAGPVRRARHLRPLRRRHRVLHRSPRRPRIPAGARDGAGRVQRVVPRPLLAAEGGLPLRLQHAQRRRRCAARGRDRAQPGARRACAGRCRCAARRCSPSVTARAIATACGTSSRTCRSSTAFPTRRPLGRYAGPLLEKYLRAGGEFGTGRRSPRLLATFGATAMTATAGITDDDSRAGFRRDVCQFSDDRLGDAGQGRLHARGAARATWPRCACSSTTSSATPPACRRPAP